MRPRALPPEATVRGAAEADVRWAWPMSYSHGLIALTVERAHVRVAVADRLTDVVEGEQLVAGED